MIEVNTPVTRKSAVLVRDGGKARPLVITVHKEFITLRLLGKRQEEIIHLEGAYFGAIKARVWREKMVKAKARVERKSLNKRR